jgi:hypothetical protein
MTLPRWGNLLAEGANEPKFRGGVSAEHRKTKADDESG